MADLIQTLRDNWAVIAQAPWAFLIVAFLLTGIIWFVVKTLKAEQVSTLEARLKLRDDEIADYKRKLGGASPQQAHDRIEKLEARIAQLEADPLASLKNENGEIVLDGQIPLAPIVLDGGDASGH